MGAGKTDRHTHTHTHAFRHSVRQTYFETEKVGDGLSMSGVQSPTVLPSSVG